MKKRTKEHGVDLNKVFEEHDPNNLGKVNLIEFSFVLADSLHMLEEEIENLIIFLDYDNKKEINYRQLL